MAARPALRLQPEESAPDSWKRFFVVLTGKTNGVHESVVKHFKSLGQTKVKSPEDADYCLVFCPVVSRVGTDVSEALDHLLPDKGAVLVVMHQTINPEQVIPPSSRLVEDQRVRLTLDCLFHQDKLLQCEINKNIKANIKKFFKESKSKESNRREQTDSPDPVLKAFNFLKEEIRTMKQQQDQKIETLQFQNDEKDKKIQELQNDMSELKQKVASLVKSGSKDGPGPVVSGEEPRSLDQYTDPSVKSRSKDGRAPVVSEGEPKSPDQHTEPSVKSRLKDGPGPVVSGEEPQSPDQHTECSVKSRSKGGAGPTKTEEPGSLEDQGAASFQNIDGTKSRSNTKVHPMTILKNLKSKDFGKDRTKSTGKDPKGGPVTGGEPGSIKDKSISTPV